MIAYERKRYILQQLNKKGIINIKNISKELDVAEITVRRDFEKLEKEGKLKRVLGGAMLEEGQEDGSYESKVIQSDGAELTMSEKKLLLKEEKERVAKFAAKYVQDGDSVFIDAGTSMVPLMNILVNKNIKIITYNQLLVQNLKNPIADIFIIGGQYRPYYSINVGPVAQDVLKQFYFNKAFLGCSGTVLRQGIAYTTEMESLLMKRIALENADEAYLLLDHSKIERRGLIKIAETSVFTKVVCDKTGEETQEGFPENVIFV